MSDNVIPESNRRGDIIIDNKVQQDDGTFKYIDRIYSRIFGNVYMIQKDGSQYKGKIEKRSIKLKDGTLGFVYHADNKWFERGGLPIDKPENLVTRDGN